MREFPNATPRPWSVDDPYIENDVCEVFGGREMREVNAALIVHAVNTYEERERLLEEAAEVLRWYASDEAWTTHEVEGPDGDYGRRARAFLAKLEARDA